MQANFVLNGNTATVALVGRFDFNAHREFRETIDKALAEAAVRQLVLDFKNVDYIDSSALGMLMLLKEKADSTHRQVRLLNCTGATRQVLEIANFGKLFTMD